MEIDNNKKGLITKTWERCKSIGRARPTAGSIGASSSSHGPPMASPRRRLPKKSKSWHGSPHGEEDNAGANQHQRRSCKDSGSKSRVAPEGCFSVYVGPHKQRFVVKTEHANHPLFRILLEEAEDEYGYNCAGPIELPCDVDVFFRVLMEMDGDDVLGTPRRGCGFPKGVGGQYGAYRLLSPSRMVTINQF